VGCFAFHGLGERCGRDVSAGVSNDIDVIVNDMFDERSMIPIQ
jgi:hypothetical protein